jgi:ribosomal protein S25
MTIKTDSQRGAKPPKKTVSKKPAKKKSAPPKQPVSEAKSAPKPKKKKPRVLDTHVVSSELKAGVKTDVVTTNIVTYSDFCRICGMDRKTLSNYIDQGIPIAERGKAGVAGKIDTQVGVKWLVAKERGDASPLFKQKVGETTARRRKLENENALFEERVIMTEVVRAGLAATFALFKNEIAGTANRLSKGDNKARLEFLNEASELTDRLATRLSAEIVGKPKAISDSTS